MAIKGTVKLIKTENGWSLILVDPEQVKALAVDKFIKHDTTVSVILNIEIRRPFVEKTISQLGYLHAAVFPVFYQYYMDQGIEITTKDEKDDVHDAIKYAISFVVEQSDFKGGIHYKPKSLAGASREEVSEFIDAVIRLAAEYGMIVPEPGDYLKERGLKEFES